MKNLVHILQCSLSICLLVGLSFSANAQDDGDNETYNEKQFELIQKGPKYWNAYQKAYEKKYGELPQIDLDGAELAGKDLRGMNLDGATFRNADLRGTMFGDKEARYTSKKNPDEQLKAGTILSSSLKGANFRGADLGEFDLNVANFSKCNLEGAIFSECDMTGAKFVEANLKGADFSESSLIGASFVKADLTDADFSETDLENCTLDYAIMIRTQMESAENVRDASMENVILKESELQKDK